MALRASFKLPLAGRTGQMTITAWTSCFLLLTRSGGGKSLGTSRHCPGVLRSGARTRGSLNFNSSLPLRRLRQRRRSARRGVASRSDSAHEWREQCLFRVGDLPASPPLAFETGYQSTCCIAERAGNENGEVLSSPSTVSLRRKP